MIYNKVDVVYDPADISVLTIECKGFPACKATPLVIQPYSAKRPKMPEHLEKTEPSESRLLRAAEKKNEGREQSHHTALSFSGLKEAGNV